MTALSTYGLVVGRGGFRAGPFEFEITPRTLVAVIGPNGSGKTTLLKTLAGLLPPLAGQVAADGPAAYLPPPGTIAAEFSAEHVVTLGRAWRRGWSPLLSAADAEAARAAMAQADISHVAATPFSRLSSGQQQRVLMARLLVQEARLCLLDEPTAMLDPAQTVRIDRVVRMLVEGGRTVIVSTHRVDFAARCDLVVAIGEAVQIGAPDILLKPELLAALYGGDAAPGQSCGQFSVVNNAA